MKKPATILPTVNHTQEFIEIANDFSNPLDLVREAISNSYDAGATEISICFETEKQEGESISKITLVDNGAGMDLGQLQNFFDLGNSTRRDDDSSIGEKGHGTKVYLNSKKISVETFKNGQGLLATMDTPFRNLHNGKVPTATVESIAEKNGQGTQITIYGYNNNKREKFTHNIVKDHIMWFTKHGAIDNQFRSDFRPVNLKLKGLDNTIFEDIPQGHVFPDNSASIEKLLDDYDTNVTKAPNHYVKKIIKEGTLSKSPEISYQAIFSIEGNNAKYGYNPMLRRGGYSAPVGAYTVQERYGLWICKDYIPIQRKNDWITHKGGEFTKFHAFLNCQGLRLTANRGSVDNTPAEIIDDIESTVRKIYDEIVNSQDWSDIEWLESASSAYQSAQKEKTNYKRRINKANRSNIAEYKGETLVEPQRESGVFSMFVILSVIEKKLFPFSIIDYDTHEGIDVIAKKNDDTSITRSKLFYVEFKYYLDSCFNHAFENLHSIVCWDTALKHGENVQDLNGESREMKIVQPQHSNDYTHFFLDHPSKSHKIEVFCLKSYLKDKLGIDFRPRTSDDIL